WSNNGTSSAIGNLGAGTYSLTVKDNKNCEVVASYTLTNPPILEINVSSNNTACPACSTGTASASASGGTPPYSYEWGTKGQGSSIADLPIGTYSVNVTDANGCTNSTTVEVQADPCDISVDLSANSPSCPGANDGSVSATPSGNGTSYSYAWSTGGTGESISGLSAGSYSVEVTNNYGCEASASASLSDPSAISITLDVQDVSTRNGADGSITAIVSGGTGDYEYSWSDEANSTGSSISNLIPGEYTVLVTDGNGCQKSATATVNDYVCPDLELSADVENPKCHGGTGSISVNASGGTAPYTYQWGGGPASSAYSGIPAGSYGVNVTDSKGCQISQTFDLTEPAQLTANMGSKDISMVGRMDGEAWVNANGGTGIYTYNWDTGKNTSKITGLAAGTYTVEVIDENGCKTSGRTNVNKPNCNLTVNIAKTDISSPTSFTTIFIYY
ncbi:MAG: SprB repeat-containing protein, partial [Bacteroidota bacterium]